MNVSALYTMWIDVNWIETALVKLTVKYTYYNQNVLLLS